MAASIEDPGPLESILGREVEMHLEEHPYRKGFFATIEASVSVVNEPYFHEMYLLKLDTNAAAKLSVDHILFNPEWYRFRRGIIRRRGRVPKPGEKYRISLQKFLVSRNPALIGLGGRVYTTTHLEELKKTMTFQTRYEFSMLAYAKVDPPFGRLTERKVTVRKCPICGNNIDTWVENEPDATLTFDMVDHYMKSHKDFYQWFNMYRALWGTLIVISLLLLGVLVLYNVLPGWVMASWPILLAVTVGNYYRRRKQFRLAWVKDQSKQSG